MTENDKEKESEETNLYPLLQQQNVQLSHLSNLNGQPSAPPLLAPGRHTLYVENPPPYSITDPLQPQFISHATLLNEPVPVRTIQPSSSFTELRRGSLHDYLTQRNAIVHPLPSPTVPFGTESVRRKCPYCRRTMMTHVTRSPNMCTYLSSLMLCCIGLNCCCCFLPFCLDVCNDVEHHCELCNAYLGRHDGCLL